MMSHKTVYHEVEINRDQLLDLFLGDGDVVIFLDDQVVTLYEVNSCRTSEISKVAKTYAVDVLGKTNKLDELYASGVAKITQSGNSKIFTMKLELDLHDRFE